MGQTYNRLANLGVPVQNLDGWAKTGIRVAQKVRFCWNRLIIEIAGITGGFIIPKGVLYIR
jgi:uncharacterized membrane protein